MTKGMELRKKARPRSGASPCMAPALIACFTTGRTMLPGILVRRALQGQNDSAEDHFRAAVNITPRHARQAARADRH